MSRPIKNGGRYKIGIVFGAPNHSSNSARNKLEQLEKNVEKYHTYVNLLEYDFLLQTGYNSQKRKFKSISLCGWFVNLYRPVSPPHGLSESPTSPLSPTAPSSSVSRKPGRGKRSTEVTEKVRVRGQVEGRPRECSRSHLFSASRSMFRWRVSATSFFISWMSSFPCERSSIVKILRNGTSDADPPLREFGFQ